jgi:hypothetical protein
MRPSGNAKEPRGACLGALASSSHRGPSAHRHMARRVRWARRVWQPIPPSPPDAPGMAAGGSRTALLFDDLVGTREQRSAGVPESWITCSTMLPDFAFA